MQATIYQDTDPLGRGEWYGYVAQYGHISKNFGPHPTAELAREHAVTLVGSADRVIECTYR